MLVAARDDLEEVACRLGCKRHDLRAPAHAPRVADDVDSADASRVTGTPSFFVNGRRHDGAYDIEALSELAREALATDPVALAPR